MYKFWENSKTQYKQIVDRDNRYSFESHQEREACEYLYEFMIDLDHVKCLNLEHKD